MEKKLEKEVQYAGFWIRLCALIIDSIWMSIVMYVPIILIAWFGLLDSDSSAFLVSYVFFEWLLPLFLVLWMWVKFQATPGKMLLKIKIVDSKTLKTASLLAYFVRYLGYFLSMIPLFLGYFWAGWDKKKRGFHDMVSGTVVVHCDD